MDGGGGSERGVVEAYLRSFALEECLDEAINEVVEKRPANPYTAIARFLESKTIAEILDVKIACCIVGRGMMGVEACIVTNLSTFAASVSDATYSNDSSDTSDMIREYAVLQEKTRDSLKGLDPNNVAAIDEAVASVPGMEKPVALALSMACCRAGARHKGQELYKFLAELAGISPGIPVPVVSVVTRAAGGSVATSQIVTLTPTAPSFFEGALEATLKATCRVQNYIDANKTALTTSDSGCPRAISPSLADTVKMVQSALMGDGESDALEGGLKIGVDMRAGDVSFVEQEGEVLQYRFDGADGPALSGEEVLEMLLALCKDAELISVEDPLASMDAVSLQQLKEKAQVMLTEAQTAGSGLAYNIAGVGGDAGCGLQIIADRGITKPEQVAILAQEMVYNTVKLSLRKIGSISATMALGRACQQAQLTIIVGCDEGAPESNDTFIADLAVALGVGQFAGGGLSSCEYSSKYQRILEISRADDSLPYAGRKFRGGR